MTAQLELFPEVERVEPDQNLYHFYRMRLQPDLFGGVSLLREWGRIGTAGRAMAERFEDAGQAVDALLSVYRTKQKCGYRLV